MTRAVRLAFAALYVVVLVVGLGLGLRVMAQGYSPVPFADFWSSFDFIASALDGDVGIADFWAQHNEHRIAIARMQFVVDYALFDGTNVFLFAAIVASSLALAATFAAAVLFETRDWLLALGTLATGVAATMSPAGWENLTWAFQVQFVQVFLFAALSVLAVVMAARTSSDRRSQLLVAGCCLAAVAATYSMANGFFVWPVVVGLGALLGLGRLRLAALVVVGAATIASFFWRLEYGTTGELDEPLEFATFVAAYLGSAVAGAGLSAATALGAVGLVLLAFVYILAWKSRASASVAAHVGAGVATFVVLSAAQTAAGRLHLGTSQALASRYAIASFTFWLALLVALVPTVAHRFPSYRWAAPAFLALAGFAALLVGYRSVPDPDYLRSVVFGKEATVLAYRAAVNDTSETVTGVVATASVAPQLRWLERERLGPWAPGGMVDAMEVDAHPSTTRPCIGAVESDDPVIGGRRLRGWIASAQSGTSRNLVVLDAARRQAGSGRVGAPRDVAAPGPVAEWNGFVAYVGGDPVAPLSVVLLGEDGSARCRLVA